MTICTQVSVWPAITPEGRWGGMEKIGPMQDPSHLPLTFPRRKKNHYCHFFFFLSSRVTDQQWWLEREGLGCRISGGGRPTNLSSRPPCPPNARGMYLPSHRNENKCQGWGEGWEQWHWKCPSIKRGEEAMWPNTNDDNSHVAQLLAL